MTNHRTKRNHLERGAEAALRREAARNRLLVAALLAMLLLPSLRATAGPVELSKGQTLYVPLYSEVPFGDGGGTLLVRATVTVRNTDPSRPLTVASAKYHDANGSLVRNLAEKSVRVPPLGSTRFDIRETDTSGGTSASVLVTWNATAAINPPIVESLMITTWEGQGISFLSRGQPVATGTD